MSKQSYFKQLEPLSGATTLIQREQEKVAMKGYSAFPEVPALLGHYHQGA